MSIEMMTLVWRHSRNKGSVLLMELAIADHAHDDGTGAYPSIERLTRYARLSTRNAQYLIRKLEASKEITVIPNAGPKGTNVFRINTALLRKLPDMIRGGAKFAPLQKKPKGCNPAREGCNPASKGCNPTRIIGCNRLHPIRIHQRTVIRTVKNHHHHRNRILRHCPPRFPTTPK